MYSLILRNEAYLPIDDSSETDGQQYLDLEVFLLGIKLQDLLPLFKKHCATLEILFSMTEQDLKQVGGLIPFITTTRYSSSLHYLTLFVVRMRN